jgi:hypothetical protein
MLCIKHLLNTLMNANIIEASLVRLENGDVFIYTPITYYSCCLYSLEHCGMLVMCTKYNFGPKEVVNGTLRSYYWLPIAKKLLLHITKSLMKLLGM